MHKKFSGVWIMAYTTIDDPSAYFQTALYTGSTSSVTVTNDGNSNLQPDWLWIKSRSSTTSHDAFDSSRGITSKRLFPNLTNAEDSNGVASVTSNGFTTGTTLGNINNNGDTYVAWQWKCNGGTSSASGSESGSNLAYDFQVNTTSKFMINKYTGRGSSSTLNLGNHFTPEFMIFKNRSQADDWVVYHHKNTAYPWTDHLHLNTTAATSDDEQMFEDVVFAADEINLGTNHEVNADGENYVAYAFAGVQGYSKFGSYTGNGNADGPFIYTGFKPAWILVKRTDSTNGWFLMDNKRNPFNLTNDFLRPNTNDAEAEAANSVWDMLSNGFKIRGSGADVNGNGSPHIYMAFAEHPFVSSEGVPVTAR
jgi:hypothetical protein